MFVEKVKTEGLAHLSYVVGSQGKAAIIDPRRDCEIYINIANEYECNITCIFETHRNEDLISGAFALARKTNAIVYHGPNAAEEIAYAETTFEDDEYSLGELNLKVLETPGHTDDSLSIILKDTNYGEDAVAVFTGDALFVGDVGRVDFYPERKHEVAGLLFDSLQKLEKLGDQTIIYPAHGAGSVCGSGMADREESTIGYERVNNPLLGIKDRCEFIATKVNEHHYYPPYFRRMEKLNVIGAHPDSKSLPPQPLMFTHTDKIAKSSTIVDVRSASAFLGAHVLNSLSIPLRLIGSFAGWLLDPNEELILVASNFEEAKLAKLQLHRIRFDCIAGYLAPSLTAWAASGGSFGTIQVLDSSEVHHRIYNKTKNWSLLDVRGKKEHEKMSIPGTMHIYVGELPEHLENLEKDKSYTVMCGSGARATIAASLLIKAGFNNVDLFLGSMGAWQSHGYETTQQ